MTNLLKSAGSGSAHSTSAFTRIPKTQVSAGGAKRGLAALPANTKLALGIGVAAVALIAIAVPIVLGDGSAAQELNELASEADAAEEFSLFPNSLGTSGFAPIESSTGGPTAAMTPASAELDVQVESDRGGSSHNRGDRANSGTVSTGTVHELQRNELLSTLAQRYYGKSSLWRAIAEANGLSEADIRRLQPGTKLKIPALDGFRGSNPSASVSSTNVSGSSDRTDAMPNAERGLLVPTSAGVNADPSNGFAASGLNTTPQRRLVPRTVFPGGIHVLREGDNHFRLAIRYYGQEHLMEAMRIRQANPHVDWPDIQPGTRVTIPPLVVEEEQIVPVASRASAPEATSGRHAAASPQGRTHEVQEGDTLSGIARRYYGSPTPDNVRKIQDANSIADPRTIRVGQRLIIP